MHAWKYLLKLVATAVFTLAGITAQAQLTPGKDYLAITPPQPTPPGKNIEVLEFFWYACPHCYHLQPSLHEWLKRKPADVSFRSQPAAFDESWTQLARTFYSIDAIAADKLHGEIFTAIHKTNKLNPKLLAKDPKTLFNWVGEQKVDVKKFADAYNSFAVVNKTKRTMDITSAYGITGTPSLAIDGRYLISPAMVPSTAGNTVDYERFFKNVDQVIAMARANRKGK
jgi:thiol:disulfide interchange protein DsbA